MNLKNVVGKIVKRLWPELESRTHLPLLGVVTAVSDPPEKGESYSNERPRYAVDVRLLKPDGQTVDQDIPVLRDIPVAMPAAAADRGFAGLPQPGTIVEIAFAFGRQSQPFIRTVLPFGLKLPAIDSGSQRWQQSAYSFQEVDSFGNWTRETYGAIWDEAQYVNTTATAEHVLISPEIWIGSEGENTLKISSELMQSLISALNTLASHTHNSGPGPDQGGAVSTNAGEISGQKTRLDQITKN
jgi:hypothetical protein